MCRLAAYTGPEISLGKFLIDPDHSLYRQSWAPRELTEARINADGFGFAWRDNARHTHVYTNTQAIWTDHNLTALAATLLSQCWLTSVRSATPGHAITHTNTQPFKSDHILFAHNGFIENFHPAVRARFHARLTPQIQAEIQGSTDSEYVFALFKQLRLEQDNVHGALTALVDSLADIAAGHKVILNLIVHDGVQFHLLRHAMGAPCPTLYISQDDSFFPSKSNVIASEALTDSTTWQAVPEHHYTTLTAGTPPDFIAV